MAVEWGLAEEIFSVKIFFFALTPVFSVDFFYNIHSSWHYNMAFWVNLLQFFLSQ